MKSLSLAAVIAASCATVAIADGVQPVAPTPLVMPVAPAPASDWTGFYVGGRIGTLMTTGEDDEGGFEQRPLSLGLNAGYLHDMGSYVLGGELGWTRTALPHLGDASYHTLDAKGLVGYDAGQFMPYLTVGASRVEGRRRGISMGTASGIVYGVGGKYMVNDRIMLGAELMEHRYTINGSSSSLGFRSLALTGAFKF